MPPPTLPPEVLISIVQALVPANNSVIYSQDRDVTKTLLAFTQVCKNTYPTASALLWQNCLYINTEDRAASLSAALRRSDPEVLRLKLPVRMFLQPFAPEPSDEMLMLEIEDDISFSLESALENPRAARLVENIFLKLAPVLQSLVIDMPLRSLRPEDDDHGVRLILRHGFEALINLEEFISVRDELYLSVIPNSLRSEPEVWATCWPKLRRIALYNPILDPGDKTWKEMAALPHLEMAIFSRSDPSGLGDINIKQEWFDAVAAVNRDRKQAGKTARRKDMAFAFIDTTDELSAYLWADENWKQIDPDRRVPVSTFGVDWLEFPIEELIDGIPTPRDLCQEWLKVQALYGVLWENAGRGNPVGTS